MDGALQKLEMRDLFGPKSQTNLAATIHGLPAPDFPIVWYFMNKTAYHYIVEFSVQVTFGSTQAKVGKFGNKLQDLSCACSVPVRPDSDNVCKVYCKTN